MSKPSIPKGTRDFLPQESIRRNYIFNKIQPIFRKYGFLPIETPAVENLDTLLGKYGEEGDRLIFRILNSGTFLSNIVSNEKSRDRWIRLFEASKSDTKAIESDELKEDLPKISNKALRYDLTVPFARFVVQHQNDITFPFKRYQIQPVWRADKPQKGRYREFYQCDVDVIGSSSLLNELELLHIIDEVFGRLKLPVSIKINNRKILQALVEYIGEPDKFMDITVAIDKLDKVGFDKVIEELLKKGVSAKGIENFKTFYKQYGVEDQDISSFLNIFNKFEEGRQGVKELDFIFSSLVNFPLINAKIKFDITLARGLNYYTGTIIEVVTEGFPGSICGGGRYDDLTGIFGLPDVSGVGISFGADRIYDVLSEAKLFPQDIADITKVMFANFGLNESAYTLPLVQKIRSLGINTELYPDAVKMKKQMKYADQKGVEFVVLIGEKEMETGMLSVKDMRSGEQMTMDIDELIKQLK